MTTAQPIRLVSVLLTAVLLGGALTPAAVSAQIPGVGSLIPDKSALLDQAKKLVTDLTELKQNPKLPAAEAGKVDAMIPKATAVSSELGKPQVEPSRLAQLAGQLGDLQKQYGSLLSLLK